MTDYVKAVQAGRVAPAATPLERAGRELSPVEPMNMKLTIVITSVQASRDNVLVFYEVPELGTNTIAGTSMVKVPVDRLWHREDIADEILLDACHTHLQRVLAARRIDETLGGLVKARSIRREIELPEEL